MRTLSEGWSGVAVLMRRYRIYARVWSIAFVGFIVVTIAIGRTDPSPNSPIVAFGAIYWLIVRLGTFPLYWMWWRLWRAGYNPITNKWRHLPDMEEAA